MVFDGALELLSEDDATALLARGEVGRVGFTIGGVPVIIPVNYRLVDGSVVFRTAVGAKLSAAEERVVMAFEVDDFQVADRTGWSVLAVGTAEVVHDLDVTFKLLDAHLEPFVGGDRGTIVRIRPTFISGRRIVRDADSTE
jgi:nitroimidazol reductase NimA-like FMN-containing flavoprotein (pyridoxamine 5'-phosphate oxidase superfamily)